MALDLPDQQHTTRDGFETYYTEKLWDWIPEVYRHEDGLAENPGVLRAIVEILAGQAAIARRSIDRLWEDEFIDFADDWAVAYIGDLVGTRLVHALNRRGRRTDVAKTIFYRRRKGTLLVLESLIRDITGWEGVVVEAFKRLGRSRHGLDPEPLALGGTVTGTPPGGTADLRRARGGDLVDGPFDEYAHTADFRQLQGPYGRYNIPKLNFHLYRLRAFPVRFATAFDQGARRFGFDPSGRDIPLFRPAQGRETEEWTPAKEWQIPAPIPCRLLGAARYVMIPSAVPTGLEIELAPFLGQRFVDEARLRRTLASLLDAVTLAANIAEILGAAVTADSPKVNLIPAAVSVAVGADDDAPPFPPREILPASLDDWGASLLPAAEKRLVIDPERGRFLLLQDPAPEESVFVPIYQYGFSGEVGAGTYDRRGFVATDGVTDLPDGGPADPGPVTGFGLPTDGNHQFVNSKTYEPDAPPGNVVADVDQLCLQAADRQRPYVRLIPDGGASEWGFTALAKPLGGDPEDPENQRLLTLEGLWVGIVPSPLAPQVVAGPEEPCDPVPATLVLDGVFDRVIIRHATIDPGGEIARVDPLQCTAIPAVAIEIRGQIAELIIESSIVGEIRESTSEVDPCSVDKIIIRDSIVQSLRAGEPAIRTRVGEVEIERSTVFGDLRVNRLFASEALIQGLVRVLDNQHGCFRFSATDDTPDTRLPPQFESHLFAPGIPNHVFVSRRFGDPGYAQLSDTAPEEILRGAETGSEIGVFSSLLGPIKRDDLAAKVGEFMPFGLIAQFINET